MTERNISSKQMCSLVWLNCCCSTPLISVACLIFDPNPGTNELNPLVAYPSEVWAPRSVWRGISLFTTGAELILDSLHLCSTNALRESLHTFKLSGPSDPKMGWLQILPLQTILGLTREKSNYFVWVCVWKCDRGASKMKPWTMHHKASVIFLVTSCYWWWHDFKGECGRTDDSSPNFSLRR